VSYKDIGTVPADLAAAGPKYAVGMNINPLKTHISKFLTIV